MLSKLARMTCSARWISAIAWRNTSVARAMRPISLENSRYGMGESIRPAETSSIARAISRTGPVVRRATASAQSNPSSPPATIAAIAWPPMSTTRRPASANSEASARPARARKRWVKRSIWRPSSAMPSPTSARVSSAAARTRRASRAMSAISAARAGARPESFSASAASAVSSASETPPERARSAW